MLFLFIKLTILVTVVMYESSLEIRRFSYYMASVNTVGQVGNHVRKTLALVSFASLLFKTAILYFQNQFLASVAARKLSLSVINYCCLPCCVYSYLFQFISSLKYLILVTNITIVEVFLLVVN